MDTAMDTSALGYRQAGPRSSLGPADTDHDGLHSLPVSARISAKMGVTSRS